MSAAEIILLLKKDLKQSFLLKTYPEAKKKPVKKNGAKNLAHHIDHCKCEIITAIMQMPLI